jgi:hypothetical protein
MCLRVCASGVGILQAGVFPSPGVQAPDEPADKHRRTHLVHATREHRQRERRPLKRRTMLGNPRPAAFLAHSQWRPPGAAAQPSIED